MFQDIQVLHVDDDPAIRDLTAEFLEQVDDSISVRSESDPTAVPARIDAEQIDCIVSDYNMPECNGLELCWSVRKERPWLPFVLFTSERGEEIAERALDTGATDFIQKETGTHHYSLLANRITLAVTRHRAIQRLRDNDALPSEWPPGAATPDRSEAPSDADAEPTNGFKS
ncbi:response regulator [Natronomonas marina]|jgi:CheY-like chemotaxis protein|uniref:response regulator n=1 Tax=Natronomonas marina TaxID=2961939 RepID=UPI0020C96910|nr:response regulator [Natronomonas marina]